MKRYLPVALLLLVGCSADDAKEAVARATAPEESVRLAGKAVPSAGIAMSWEGNTARVGDSWEAAQKVFPEVKRGAYQLRSLPQRFGRDYEAHGWETNEGQGYGVITYKDLVVAAIYHIDGVDDDHAQRYLDAQRSATRDLQMQEVKNGKLLWNFWEDKGATQRLMVLRVKGVKGVDVTILMGDDKVLDALGATKPVTGNPAVAPFLSSPPTPLPTTVGDREP